MYDKGFSLIELMIVVAIVAILAAISIPAYQDFMVRSRLTDVLGAMSACKLNAVEFYQENAGWTDAGGVSIDNFDLCSRPQGTKHIEPGGLTIDPNGVISAVTRDLGPGVPDGGVVTMSPQFNGLNVTGWICGAAGTTLEARHRPGSCQG